MASSRHAGLVVSGAKGCESCEKKSGSKLCAGSAEMADAETADDTNVLRDNVFFQFMQHLPERRFRRRIITQTEQM